MVKCASVQIYGIDLACLLFGNEDTFEGRLVQYLKNEAQRTGNLVRNEFCISVTSSSGVSLLGRTPRAWPG